MQFEGLAALQHQFAGERLVLDRKFEFIGLDRPGALRADTRLDQFALVGLENEPLVNDIVQLPALHPLAEDEVEAEIEEHGQPDGYQNGDDAPIFFHNFSVRPHTAAILYKDSKKHGGSKTGSHAVRQDVPAIKSVVTTPKVVKSTAIPKPKARRAAERPGD